MTSVSVIAIFCFDQMNINQKYYIELAMILNPNQLIFVYIFIGQMRINSPVERHC